MTLTQTADEVPLQGKSSALALDREVGQAFGIWPRTPGCGGFTRFDLQGQN